MKNVFVQITVVGFLCLACPVSWAQRAGEELQYPGKDFAKLDTFESLNLQDADKLYAQKDYKGAFAAYRAYSFEFAKSPALPYVLLRMGRCLHHLGKRYAAIKAYQDVVDYFPDDIRYAAAALFYIGQCHGQNGDEDKQTAVWARMVKDDEYVAQPNSGTALIHLGRLMEELEKYEEAIEYHWRTAVNFAESNRRAAADARNAVIHHYTVRRPNHAKLKAFYTETSAYGDRYRNGENPEEDDRYWQVALDRALKYKNEAACRYWAGKIGDKFIDNDGMRIRLFNCQNVYEKDQDAWMARMTKQFTRQPVTLDRLLGWIPHFGSPERQLAFVMKYAGPIAPELEVGQCMQIVHKMRWHRDQFYDQFVLAKVSGLKNEAKIGLMGQVRKAGLHAQAQSILRQVSLNGLSDEQIRQVGMFAAAYLEEEDVLRYFSKIQDPLYATKARFDYYWNGGGRGIRNAAKALAEIPALKKSPQHAQGLDWIAAELLQGLGRHEEAIKAYRAANRQPDSTWRITDCLIALKQYGEAIKNVQGLQSVGGGVAAQAALKIADIYRLAGDKGKEVDQLRVILRRYPKSRESSIAHERLENYGVKLVGGVAEAEE